MDFPVEIAIDARFFGVCEQNAARNDNRQSLSHFVDKRNLNQDLQRLLKVVIDCKQYPQRVQKVEIFSNQWLQRIPKWLLIAINTFNDTQK